MNDIQRLTTKKKEISYIAKNKHPQTWWDTISKHTAKRKRFGRIMYGISRSNSKKLSYQPMEGNNIFLPVSKQHVYHVSKQTINSFVEREMRERLESGSDITFEDGVLFGLQLSTFINKVHHDCDQLVSQVLNSQIHTLGRDSNWKKSELFEDPSRERLDNLKSSYRSFVNLNRKMSECLVDSSLHQATQNLSLLKNSYSHQLAQDEDVLALKKAFEQYKMK